MSDSIPSYGSALAKIYNEQWSAFADHVAPGLVEFYSRTPAGRAKRVLLDLCCGTGQLARHFLAAGFPVIGLDLSEHMLAHARENNAEATASGQARFVVGDAADFKLDQSVGLVVSTYDALNHLDGFESLKRCFGCVFRALEPEAYFVFDLNTRIGLTHWIGTAVEERDDSIVIKRGYFDAEIGRAGMTVSGFLRRPDGLYERFRETVSNTEYKMQAVRKALDACGFREITFHRVIDLSVPIDDPEAESRVFVVAKK
jgi:SAM-dependent methyltransferase